MLRGILQIFLFLTAGATLAQGTPKTLLWKVSGKGAEKPSFLFGTMHSQDDRAFGLGDTVYGAMESVSVVAGELDLQNATQEAVGMMGAMLLPDGQQLEDLFKKKDWALIDAELKEQLGPMAALTYRMKPFFVLAMLASSSMEKDEELVLDDHLLSKARSQGKRVIGLETVKEQMAAMDAQPVKEQAAMLLDHVKNKGHLGDMEAMIEAYSMQDLDAIMKITEGTNSMTKAMERSLLIDRNLKMVHRLDSMMLGKEDVFFAVGVAHLPGENGLIELLRSKGYSVEPVMYTATKEEEIQPVIEEKDN
ncbi:MAG: TraB/GumN family protein [Bacteroidota bacterium]|nr:TraB/GumN family protein [Bacteroidota bacterium]